jgi:hypothetical protein
MKKYRRIAIHSDTEDSSNEAAAGIVFHSDMCFDVDAFICNDATSRVSILRVKQPGKVMTCSCVKGRTKETLN